MKSGTGPCCQRSPTDHHTTLQIKHKLSSSYSSFYSLPEIRRDIDYKVFLKHIFFAIYMAFLCHLHFKLVNVFLYYWWTTWMQTWFSNEFCHTNYSLKISTVPFNPWSSQALKKSKLSIILLFLHHSCHIINPKICSQLNVHRQITYRNQVISTAEPQSLPEQNTKLFSSSCPSCAALWDTNTVTGNGKLQRKKSANTQQSYLQSLHPHLNGVYGHALYI